MGIGGELENGDGNREDALLDRARRLRALGALAQGIQSSRDNAALPSAAPAHAQVVKAPAKGRRIARWRAALIAVLVVAVVSGAFLALHRAPHATVSRSSGPLVLAPLDGDLNCPRDIAWSPQGTRLALIGYKLDCPRISSSLSTNALFYTGPLSAVSGLVSLYDTTHGRLVGQLHPDDAIRPLIPLPAAAAAAGVDASDIGAINYTHVLWSPDGTRLALTFDIFVPNDRYGPPSEETGYTQRGTTMDGVLLVDATGGHARVLLHAIDWRQPSTTIWNLDTGTSVPTAPGMAAPSPLAALTPALAYRWNADGTLTTAQALSAAPPLAPVGNPDGGASFSIWQPGIAASLILPIKYSQSPLMGSFNWTTDIAAWSPDGRFLAERVGLRGLLVSPQSPAPSVEARADYGWENAPLLPLRDAALQTLAMLAKHDGSLLSPYVTGVPVAWRADGRVIAVDVAATDPSKDPSAVQLYDCQTGKLLSTLKPSAKGAPTADQAHEDDMSVLRWSPDGSHLLLFDATLGTLTVWGPETLPVR